MRHWHFWVSIGVIIIFSFLFSQDFLARLAWQKYGRAEIALLLVRRDAKLAMELGRYYFNGRAYDRDAAERAFRKARDIDPELLGPRYQLSRIAFLRSDFVSALNLINEEITLHPEFKRSHYVRGLINGYAGNLAEAEKDFKEFLAWDETSWAAANDLAWIYFKQGKFADVEKIARQGLRWNPENPWLLISLGAALLNIGERAGAKAALEKAMQIAERLTPAEWGRAYPGNDPKTYGTGLNTMKETIRQNLTRVGE